MLDDVVQADETESQTDMHGWLLMNGCSVCHIVYPPHADYTQDEKALKGACDCEQGELRPPPPLHRSHYAHCVPSLYAPDRWDSLTNFKRTWDVCAGRMIKETKSMGSTTLFDSAKTLSLSHSLSLSHALALARTRSCTHSLSLSLSLSLTLTLALSLPLAEFLFLSLSVHGTARHDQQNSRAISQTTGQFIHFNWSLKTPT